MSRVYVGNLPIDVRVKDVEDIFFKYGRIIDIDLKVHRYITIFFPLSYARLHRDLSLCACICA